MSDGLRVSSSRQRRPRHLDHRARQTDRRPGPQITPHGERHS